MMKIILFFTSFLCAYSLSLSYAGRPYNDGGFYNPGPPIPYYNPDKQCPNVNCTVEQLEEMKPCKDDSECLQKEVCCNFPCDEGKTFCMKGNKEYYETHILECLVIKNCKKWKEEHKESKECEDNGDCIRSEKCCYIPCTGKRTCQKPVEVIQNSGFPIYKPIPFAKPIPANVGAGGFKPIP